MTLKINRALFLDNIKLCASFHHHMWNQTGDVVPKRLIWVLTSVTLTFDLELLNRHHFCHWYSLLKISWWHHDGNIVKKVWRHKQIDRQTDRQKDRETDRKTDSIFFIDKSIWKSYLQNIGHFLGLHIGLFDAYFSSRCTCIINQS